MRTAKIVFAAGFGILIAATALAQQPTPEQQMDAAWLAAVDQAERDAIGSGDRLRTMHAARDASKAWIQAVNARMAALAKANEDMKAALAACPKPETKEEPKP